MKEQLASNQANTIILEKEVEHLQKVIKKLINVFLFYIIIG